MSVFIRHKEGVIAKRIIDHADIQETTAWIDKHDKEIEPAGFSVCVISKGRTFIVEIYPTLKEAEKAFEKFWELYLADKKPERSKEDIREKAVRLALEHCLKISEIENRSDVFAPLAPPASHNEDDQADSNWIARYADMIEKSLVKTGLRDKAAG